MRGANSAVAPRVGSRQVLVTWPNYDDNGDSFGRTLRDAGLTLRLAPKLGSRSPEELRELAADAAAAIVSTDPFDAGVLAACPSLCVIARVGVGVDSIDLDAATANGVAVTVTPGANEVTVADHAVALMLAVLRRVPEHDRDIRRGGWNRTGDHTPWTLSGCTVGLVGFGRIGRLVAERLAGFGVEMLATDPVRPSGELVDPVELDELLRRSDVVSVHAPLLPSTRGLIGAKELQRMRRNAILVNTSRGGVVDEAALVEALRSGELRGAGLDVFSAEPPRHSQLLELRNVVLSPHIAGLSDDSIEQMLRRATASVLDVLSGRLPADLANPEVLKHPAFLVGLASSDTALATDGTQSA
jgi:phosphoglycerate dehydrogenase-like enzyme